MSTADMYAKAANIHMCSNSDSSCYVLFYTRSRSTRAHSKRAQGADSRHATPSSNSDISILLPDQRYATGMTKRNIHTWDEVMQGYLKLAYYLVFFFTFISFLVSQYRPAEMYMLNAHIRGAVLQEDLNLLTVKDQARFWPYFVGEAESEEPFEVHCLHSWLPLTAQRCLSKESNMPTRPSASVPANRRTRCSPEGVSVEDD